MIVFLILPFCCLATPILAVLWRRRGGGDSYLGAEASGTDEDHAPVSLRRVPGFDLQLSHQRLVRAQHGEVHESRFKIWRDSISCHHSTYFWPGISVQHGHILKLICNTFSVQLFCNIMLLSFHVLYSFIFTSIVVDRILLLYTVFHIYSWDFNQLWHNKFKKSGSLNFCS